MAKPRSKDNTAINVSILEAERSKLLVNRNDPKRLKEVERLLDWINYGIKNRNDAST